MTDSLWIDCPEKLLLRMFSSSKIREILYQVGNYKMTERGFVRDIPSLIRVESTTLFMKLKRTLALHELSVLIQDHTVHRFVR